MNNFTLFDGDDSLFKEVIRETQVYGEYGCGLSTEWVAQNTDCDVISVDTSKQWVDKVLSKTTRKVNLSYIDVGPVGGWGTPLTMSKAENFIKYAENIWQQDESPDTVLIDGRFRVCCFLVSLKYCKVNTKIIFDDYTTRPQYHYIEKYAKPIKTFGRQALFIISSKDNIDSDELAIDIEKFRYLTQ